MLNGCQAKLVQHRKAQDEKHFEDRAARSSATNSAHT